MKKSIILTVLLILLAGCSGTNDPDSSDKLKIKLIDHKTGEPVNGSNYIGTFHYVVEESDTNFEENDLKAFPNPFSNHLVISFTLLESQKVTVSIETLDGTVIDTIVSKELPSGKFKFEFFPETKLKNGFYNAVVKKEKSTNRFRILRLRGVNTLLPDRTYATKPFDSTDFNSLGKATHQIANNKNLNKHFLSTNKQQQIIGPKKVINGAMINIINKNTYRSESVKIFKLDTLYLDILTVMMRKNLKNY